MTTRHLVLAITAVVVLGMGVYLFHEVRSSPAAVDVEPAPVAQTPSPSETPAARPAGLTPHGQPRPQVVVQPAAPEPPTAPTAQTSDDNEPSIDDMMKANPKLDAIMDRANKAYDHQDYDEAKTIAGKVLAKQPTNVRMLRIMVSSSCIDNDIAVAQKYFPQLPKGDREQLKQRCDRYGVTLTDPQ